MNDPKTVSATDVSAAIARIPFAAHLGVRADLRGDELTMVLPFRDQLIGNPMLPAIHGGVIGAFMELTAVATLGLALKHPKLPKTIDISIDYLRSGRPTETYARAHVTKLGRRIANVRVEAWQYEVSDPIAALHGHFLVPREEEG